MLLQPLTGPLHSTVRNGIMSIVCLPLNGILLMRPSTRTLSKITFATIISPKTKLNSHNNSIHGTHEGDIVLII